MCGRNVDSFYGEPVFGGQPSLTLHVDRDYRSYQPGGARSEASDRDHIKVHAS